MRRVNPPLRLRAVHIHLNRNSVVDELWSRIAAARLGASARDGGSAGRVTLHHRQAHPQMLYYHLNTFDGARGAQRPPLRHARLTEAKAFPNV